VEDPPVHGAKPQERKSWFMNIRYIGFNVVEGSRIYGFDVIDDKESHQFTVEVQSEAFGPSQLRLQDGPDICFARLKKGLQDATQDAHTEGHLNIVEQDIRAYLETHRPTKTFRKRKLEGLDVGANGSH
jgi:hypothetical protein